MKATSKKTAAAKAPAKGAAAAKPAAAKTIVSKTPLREWIANGPASATAKLDESDLPDYKKLTVPEGSRLTALLIEDAEGHWRIKDGAIAGKSLPRNIRYIYKAQWTLLPGPDAALAVPAVVDAETAASPAEEAAPAEVFRVESETTTAPLPEPAAPAAEIPAPATERAKPPGKLSICIRGFRAAAPHLKQYDTRVEDGQSSYQRWIIYRTARSAALYDEAHSPAGRALIEKMPGTPPNRFESEINSGGSDVYLLSFPLEGFFGLHKSKSTGMILPLRPEFMGNAAFSSVDYQKIAQRAGPHLTEEGWTFLQNEFDYLGTYDNDLLAADVEAIFTRLRGKIVIVVMLNTKVGNPGWLLKLYGRTNLVVRPVAEKYGVEIIEINEFVQSADDLAHPKDDGGNFKPRVYRQVAERVAEIIAKHQGGDAMQAGGAAEHAPVN